MRRDDMESKRNPFTPGVLEAGASKLLSDPSIVSYLQYAGLNDVMTKAGRYVKGKRKRGKANPAVSAEQYGLMQAVASGTAKVKGISQKVAEEIIRKTPKGVRSKFAKILASKRNPEDLTGAENVSREWHGREPKETIDITEYETYDETGAVLADLEELGIIGNDGECYSIKFKSDRPKLIANVAKTNLEIVGGDQELSGLESNGKLEIPIGYVYQIVYETDKHHLEGSNGYPESYEHFFGEEFYKEEGYDQDDYENSDDYWQDIIDEGVAVKAIMGGYLPMLMYKTRDKKMELAGGKYDIRDVGIVD